MKRGFYVTYSAAAVCFFTAACLIPGKNQETDKAGTRAEYILVQYAGSGRGANNNANAGNTRESSGTLTASYRFANFNGDDVYVVYSMRKTAYSAYLDGYGYTDAEINPLQSRRKAMLAGARYRAGNGEKKAEFDKSLSELLGQKGLVFRPSTMTIEPDVPSIVKNNREFMRQIAMEIQKTAEKNGYSSEETIGTALSMAQTAIKYGIPPLVDKNGRHIAGIFPPVRTIFSGWGDCDTKTALTAAVLSNWSGIKMIGISVPNHYLMAVKRLPAQGDVFVRYNGLEYVLMEPSGPARLPPGQIGTATTELLEKREDYRLEPFFGI